MDKFITTNMNDKEHEMGEFYGIAEGILERIKEQMDGVFRSDEREIITDIEVEDIGKRGLTVNEVRNIAYSRVSKNINFYPGIPGAPCYNLAVFVSLNSPIHARGTKHLKFRKALETIVQHMDRCINTTKTIVFITDSWDAKAFDEWEGMLEKIRHEIHFEIYLIAGRTISQIRI